jgi:hypothetical protein
MPLYQQPSRYIKFFAHVLSLLAIVVSTLVLCLATIPHGVSINPDAPFYLETGYNFAHGQGMRMPIYAPDTDTIRLVPITHFPPFLPLLYALGLYVGISWYEVPTIISIIGWIAFISGVGMLTYRLGRSAVTTAVVLILTAMAPSFFDIFTSSYSEVVFLPLLVWLMIVLIDLPRQEQGWYWRLGIAAILLAMLILTRYVGVFVLAAVGLWWVWWHIRRPGKLIKGGLLLSGSLLPFLAWTVRNALQSDEVMGVHFAESTHSFMRGIAAMFYQSVSVLMPTTNFESMQRNFGTVITLILLLALIASLGFIVWRYRPRNEQTALLPLRTPIVLFILLYVLLYTLAQPFLSFHPMDMRYMTVILCLSLPVLGAILAWLPATWWTYGVLSGYVALNAAFAFGPVAIYGFPEWISVFPPAIHDVSETRDAFQDRERGYLAILRPDPPRTRTLLHHHPELSDWIQSMDTPMVVITNGEFQHLMFTMFPSTIGAHPWIRQTDYINMISCESSHSRAYIVFEGYWYIPTSDPEMLRTVFEQKCPDHYRQDFEHSTVYLFGNSALSQETEP